MSDTSREAYDSMHPEPASTDRATVLACYRTHGAMTADECARRLGWDAYRARRRVTELKQAGKLNDTGKRRNTKSGRKAAVLEAVPVTLTQTEMF